MGYHIGFGAAAITLLGLFTEVSVARAARTQSVAELPPNEATQENAIQKRGKVSTSPPGPESLGRERFEGTTLALRRDIRLLISNDSKYHRKHTARLPVGKRGAKIPVETVKVDGRRVDVLLPKHPRGGVLIESAGQIQTIVTEGRASIVEQRSKIAIGAIDGSLLVGKAGRFKTIKAGFVRIFDRPSGTWIDEPLLEAPQVRSDGLAVALGGPAPVSVRAGKIAGAKSYRATVSNDDRSTVTGTFESDDSNRLQVKVPRAGNYWVTVRAVNAFGIAGRPSEPVLVQALGLKNSESVVRHGVIFLSPGQAAEIAGQEGLVMRYGTSPDFVPAPSSLSLPGQKATTVEFRDPNAPDRYAVFKLAPRLLRTRINLGPAFGVWPTDDIDISVRMWDGHGHPLSWMDEYQPVVKVGVDEVPVTWTRSQGQLTAVLPAQTGLGPWVVRVTVLDPKGNEIGRNFLEMVSPPPKKKFAKAKKR